MRASLGVCAQAFSAVLDQVVSMRDRERARDGSMNVLSPRTLRVFSDHVQETDSSTKGSVWLPLNQVKTILLLFRQECGTRAVGRIVILAGDCVNAHRPLPAQPLVCALDLQYRWACTAILEHAIIVRFCYHV